MILQELTLVQVILSDNLYLHFHVYLSPFLAFFSSSLQFVLDGEEQRLSNLKNLLNESLYRLLKYPADYNSILTCLMDTIVIGSKGFGDQFMVYVAETIYSTW